MIIPSILTDEIQAAQTQLDVYAKLSPVPPAVHIDIIDGFFADNLTIEPSAIANLDRHNLPIDIHLMTVEPIDFATELIGTDNLRLVVAQVERLSSQSEYLEFVKKQSWQAGLSLNLYTPIEAIDAPSWKLIDVVQVMSGQAGAQGQVFHPSALETITHLKQWRAQKNLNFRIMVDIGINPQTLPQAQQAGADDFVTGSYLNGDVVTNWRKLQEAVL